MLKWTFEKDALCSDYYQIKFSSQMDKDAEELYRYRNNTLSSGLPIGIVFGKTLFILLDIRNNEIGVYESIILAFEKAEIEYAALEKRLNILGEIHASK